MTNTHPVAVRTPAMITGAASGSSTFQSICIGLMPNPRAASVIAGSISTRAVVVFRKIGRML